VCVPQASAVTVAGPLAVEALGVVDAHDHLFVRSPALRGSEIEDPELVAEEMREARATGIGTIVELTPIGLGRRPDLLRRVSAETGVHVIGATGYHRDAHYPGDHWVRGASLPVLEHRVVADLLEGMHPNDWLGEAAPDAARAGVIKGGASYQRVTAGEARRLEAIGAASARTGAPIVVHTEIGTCGHEILDILLAAGARPDRIGLAHLDRNPDLELHREVVSRGVAVVYDTVGRIKYRPDSILLDLIGGMVAAGHGSSILLGLDLGTRDYYRAYGGGPGLRSLMASFAPRLRRRIGDEAMEAILVGNPARLLAMPVGP
jgi:5-phospho-D-xylono-1,4-lactonase